MTFLSANFASSLLYFSSDLQGQARFRYLGEQQVGVRTAYVVAFAQVPGVATVGISMRMPNGDKSNWLMQGIAWIDKSTFEILQMRTDLSVPLDSSSACQQRQDQRQTRVQFALVQPDGVADMMWLPTEADVHETLGDCKNPVQIARMCTTFRSTGAMTTKKRTSPPREKQRLHIKKTQPFLLVGFGN
jgi:hypothetical protein